MRNINGVFFLDKRSGISSAFSLREVKSLFQAKKAGHTGTLDPLATGMLPICLGEATKFSQYLLKSNKSYRIIAKLGECTDTFDSTGRIIRSSPVQFDEEYLKCVLNSFIGIRRQVPPMYSALKYYGRPLYWYARKGINISRHSRLIHISKINLLWWNDRYVGLEIFCSTGTYVRSFIDDLGKGLGCGAHVVSLRRCSIAKFSSEYMISFSKLEEFFDFSGGCWKYLKNIDEFLYPIDILVDHFPEINVSTKVFRLFHLGRKVEIDKISDFYNINMNEFNVDNSSVLVRMTVGYERKFFGVGNIINSSHVLVDRLIFLS